MDLDLNVELIKNLLVVNSPEIELLFRGYILLV